ncbi:tRNA glutamyl-Q(34) synthetase GluQRS [Phaeovibrio sulfidiphilus]|uniref:tRNA glutamyl-Q(34) synthetase GluQRS n=1 Tax=Phaeovibrio sulfidiphilus TaxID=1220600 RepID=A0A8J6YN09_9PROT|nr:tRNA glutamyl-Q(34) synthetase GluQRS [Phaeovibrio sulfidiphilus]MBE1237475.1 tRNA glutamyl-Q(34) synthetase GluQRS [Phaeovibrio sulfidiphilus]
MTTVTRFAPSPTGLLHLGHAYSALLAQDEARRTGGRFLLRIEDIDPTRCRPEFETALYEDLAWLGLNWETPVRRQSEHLAFYREALSGLAARGLLYPCFCTRRDIEAAAGPDGPRGPDGLLYPGTCRSESQARTQARIAAGEPFALRLDLRRALACVDTPLLWTDLDAGEQQARPEQFGDVILARKETPTSYHLSVTLDDALQGVTRVVRGQDLFEATHVHRLLQALLGLPTPLYRHHRLLAGPDGRRYAKSAGSLSLRALREAGETPDSIRARIGLPPERV